MCLISYQMKDSRKFNLCAESCLKILFKIRHVSDGIIVPTQRNSNFQIYTFIFLFRSKVVLRKICEVKIFQKFYSSFVMFLMEKYSQLSEILTLELILFTLKVDLILYNPYKC